MKKTPLLFLLAASCVAQLSFGQGFAPTAAPWANPAGGQRSAGVTRGFLSTSYLSLPAYDDAGSQSWSVLDLNGDNRPDLVVTAECQASPTRLQTFGTASNRYWNVYLGTGSGFAATPTSWANPAGGQQSGGITAGFYLLGYNSANADDAGSQSWTVLDMNGDNRPDLVVTAERQGNAPFAFGTASNRYWKVYLNTGSGFAATPTTWTNPAGGQRSAGVTRGFLSTSYLSLPAYDDAGSQSWSVLDLNGDSRPDLVVTAECQANPDHLQSFGTASSRYWNVYLNTGSGFAATPTSWANPAGGQRNSGITAGFYLLGYNSANADDSGSQSWSVLDVNADSKPDLVVTAERQASGLSPFGTASNRNWNVYLNTGSGFSTTPTTWATPAGGQRSAGVTRGFYTTGYLSLPAFDDAGSQSWSVLDLNGDRWPDLVVTGECQVNPIHLQTFGAASSRYWNVYLGTGSGFAATPTSWANPAGGQQSGGITAGFYLLGYNSANADDAGSQSWSVLDLNGDNRPDLVVTAERQGNAPFAFGTAGNRYWNVYLNTSTGSSTAAAAAAGLSLYPSPATEKVLLTGLTTAADYTLVDYAGRTVQAGHLNAAGPAALDVRQLPTGLYLLRLSQAGHMHSLRFEKK